jgi:hypothetical protein
MNLESNIPCQYIDRFNKLDRPLGILKPVASGQKRVSDDLNAYLDLTKPGKIHYFTSIKDIEYMQRYKSQPQKHELSKGKISSISPFIRLYDGISVLHEKADDIKIIETMERAILYNTKDEEGDPSDELLKLLFLVRPQDTFEED